MVGERDPKGIPMYRILAFLKKKKEAKTITEISEEADIPCNTVRDNIYKLLAQASLQLSLLPPKGCSGPYLYACIECSYRYPAFLQLEINPNFSTNFLIILFLCCSSSLETSISIFLYYT